jgi:hypothetical protein
VRWVYTGMKLKCRNIMSNIKGHTRGDSLKNIALRVGRYQSGGVGLMIVLSANLRSTLNH